MKLRLVAVCATLGVAVVLTLAGAGQAVGSIAPQSHAPRSSSRVVKPSGVIHSGAFRRVVLRKLPAGGHLHAVGRAPLLETGQPEGTEFSAAGKIRAGKKAESGFNKKVSPDLIGSKYDGIAEGGCSCAPPDPSAAIGPNDTVEVAGNEINVYSNAGALLDSKSLETFFGSSVPVIEPRVMYDPTYDRWVVVATIDSPAINSSPNFEYANSETGDPTGAWVAGAQFVSLFHFANDSVLDFPMLGMDDDSIVITVNAYVESGGTDTYNESDLLSIPKRLQYNNMEWDTPGHVVPFGMAPAVVGGSPTEDTTREYLIAADPVNSVMHVMYLVNSSHYTGNKLISRPDIPYSFSPPTQRVNQPGTTVTLDSGDGRIASSPMESNGRVWFAHEVSLGDFPSVEFGWVNPGTDKLQVADAYHSGTSDDFNPSISTTFDIIHPIYTLNWAYTDPSTPVTDVYDTGTGYSLVHKAGRPYSPAGHSTTETGFGAYSSITPDYNTVSGSCHAGDYNLAVNEYFAQDGTWKTRLDDVGRGC